MAATLESRTLIGQDAHTQDIRSAIANNPFRTPQLLARNQDIRMSAMRRSMRGFAVLGLDGKVWVWLSQFLMLPVLYASTSLGSVVNSWAFPVGPIARSDTIYLHTLACVIAAFCLSYAALYGSDPGFLGNTKGQTSEEQVALQQLQLRGSSACAYCGSVPTARCKHSKASGQCVHKFDHFCWWLSTDIGDRNHGVFWVYIMLQCSLNAWAGHLLLTGMLACTGSARGMAAMPQDCHIQAALHWGLALACFGVIAATAVLFVYLAALHTYLLLTGQTMYELLRGAKVSYLAPYYRGRGRTHYNLPDEVGTLLWDELRFRGPPRPFSEGMVNNVVQQVSRSWPRPYIAKC